MNLAADYLLDTSLLSRLIDDTHAGHESAKAWESSLSVASRKIISVVAIAELRFGLELAMAANRRVVLPRLENIIRLAEQHTPLEVTRATAYEYARLKSAVVKKYMPKRLSHRASAGWGNPEAWIDEFTGRCLGTQENDLWQCAQAVERDLILASCDDGAKAIADAYGGALKLVEV